MVSMRAGMLIILTTSCAYNFVFQVKKITGEELEVEIQDRDRALIVDFFAT